MTKQQFADKWVVRIGHDAIGQFKQDLDSIKESEYFNELERFIKDNTHHYTDIATGETVLYIEYIPLIEFINEIQK